LIELKSRAHGIGPAVRPPGRPVAARRCRPPDVERGIALAPSLSFRVPGGRRLNGLPRSWFSVSPTRSKALE